MLYPITSVRIGSDVLIRINPDDHLGYMGVTHDEHINIIIPFDDIPDPLYLLLLNKHLDQQCCKVLLEEAFKHVMEY